MARGYTQKRVHRRYPGISYHVLNQEAQLMRIHDVLCEGGIVYVEWQSDYHVSRKLRT